jgi:hypothetical protein
MSPDRHPAWSNPLSGTRQGVTTTVPLFVAAALAVVAVSLTFAEAPALSVFLAVVTLPVALYAALAAPRFAVPLALAAAVAAVGVVGYWIYVLISAISKGT